MFFQQLTDFILFFGKFREQLALDGAWRSGLCIPAHGFYQFLSILKQHGTVVSDELVASDGIGSIYASREGETVPVIAFCDVGGNQGTAFLGRFYDNGGIADAGNNPVSPDKISPPCCSICTAVCLCTAG